MTSENYIKFKDIFESFNALYSGLCTGGNHMIRLTLGSDWDDVFQCPIQRALYTYEEDKNEPKFNINLFVETDSL